MASEVNKTAHEFKREALDGLLISRFFYCPAFEIYGGTSRLSLAKLRLGVREP